MNTINLIEMVEEDIDEIEFLLSVPRERIIKPRTDHFNFFSDEEFIVRFRLSKEATMNVLREIEHLISPRSLRNNALTPVTRLLLTLRLYACGNMLSTVADFCGVSKTTACDMVFLVSKALCTLRPKYVSMPQNCWATKLKFYRIAKFPRVIGAIDCTHIKIMSPGGASGEWFRNRKGYFSLNTQAVCDSNLKFLNIVARWPGSSHDETIFRNSILKQKFDKGEYGDGILLGDSRYSNRPYLLTPINNPIRNVDNLYNESHMRTRNVIERAFGVWKRRFPILKLEIRLSLTRIQAIIVATAVLHNVALDMKVNLPEEENLEGPDECINFHKLDEEGDTSTRNLLVQTHFNKL